MWTNSAHPRRESTLLLSIIATRFRLSSFEAAPVQLLNGLAAVDDNRAADGEASRIRTQPENGISDLFRPPHSGHLTDATAPRRLQDCGHTSNAASITMVALRLSTMWSPTTTRS